MSGAIAAARASLAAAMAPVGQVCDVLPDRITPPVVLLVPNDPWITTDDRPSRVADVHYTVVLIPRSGVNDAQENALTDLLEAALDAVEDAAHSWRLENVTAPYDLTVNGATYLAVKLTVTLTARITTE